MSEIKIYHNPNCSKSRKTLEILKAKGKEPLIINYKEVGLSYKELSRLIDILDSDLKSLVRNNDDMYKENPFNLKDKEELIKGLIQNPHVLQRPIVFNQNKAVVCRPPEKVLELI